MLNKHFITFFLFLQTCYLSFSIDHSLLDSYRPKPTALIKSYEKVLKMSLKSLYSEDEREHNMTAQFIMTSLNCSKAFEHFCDVMVNFTRCALKFARPIHLCVDCGNQHNKSVIAYDNLRKQGEECQKFFFGSDQVVIVDIIYKEVTDLWSKNYCPNCYKYPNRTQEFFEISNDLMKCVSNSNKSESFHPNATCVKCHAFYANLSEKYSHFVQSPDSDGNICMDVVDTMNITRKMWKEYNCIAPFGGPVSYPSVIVVLIICVTPILFYLLAKNVSIIEDVKIVRPKRKFTTIVVPDPTLSE